MRISPQTTHPVFKTNDTGKESQPKYFCASCTSLKPDLKCDYFKRRVEPSYNRCFCHSHYKPIQATFKVTDNLDEIIEAEKERFV